MMMKLDAILFDLGHTLVDFRSKREDLLEVYSEARRRLTVDIRDAVPSAEELVERLPKKISEIIDNSYLSERAIEELRMSEVVTQAFESVHLKLPEQLVHEMVLLEHETLSRSLVLAENARDVLAQLKRWGYKLGLVSNATNLPTLLRRDLDRLGILDFFDATVFSSEVGLRKPHPTIYNSALTGVGAEASNAVFVGDRVREDILGPQRLGMRAVLTHQFRQESPNGSQPDSVILQVVEMLDAVKQMRST